MEMIYDWMLGDNVRFAVVRTSAVEVLRNCLESKNNKKNAKKLDADFHGLGGLARIFLIISAKIRLIRVHPRLIF